MHLISVLALALAAGSAVSTPLNGTHLTKRANYPWIGYYDPAPNAGKKCTDIDPIEDGKHDRPRISQKGGEADCEAFLRKPGTNVKIFWGEGPYGIDEITTFYGPGCKDGDYARVYKRKGDYGSYECHDLSGERGWSSLRGW